MWGHSLPTTLALSVLVIWPSSGRTASTNLIRNGSFERPADLWMLVPPGNRDLKWTVGGNSPVQVLNNAFPLGGYQLKAKNGRQWLQLCHWPGGSQLDPQRITQTIRVAKNTKYLLTFWVGNVVDYSSRTTHIKLAINGRLIMTASNAAGKPNILTWKKFAKAISSGSSTNMQIEFISGDSWLDEFCGLDDVSLVKFGRSDQQVPDSAQLKPLNMNRDELMLTPK